jgi:hypothetical protein
VVVLVVVSLASVIVVVAVSAVLVMAFLAALAGWAMRRLRPAVGHPAIMVGIVAPPVAPVLVGGHRAWRRGGQGERPS